jgi:hypothetical protein
MEFTCPLNKVFGIGLSRTGTTSLTVALQMLGFKSIHWPHDSITQRELTAYHSGRADFRFTIARTFDAVTDTPVATVYRELSQVYPGSRFVLTVRDKTPWLESCANVFKRASRSENTLEGYLGYRATIRRQLYGRTDFDPSDFEAAYSRHVAGVLNWFEPMSSRLLVMNIIEGEGWEKLCSFLGADEPDAPFPHKNSRWLFGR